MKYIGIPDGWEVDQEKLKELILVPSKTYSIGNRFRHNDKTYLLCAVMPGSIGFINIENGKRFNGPVKVSDVASVKISELEELLESEFNTFELIE